MLLTVSRRGLQGGTQSRVDLSPVPADPDVNDTVFLNLEDLNPAHRHTAPIRRCSPERSRQRPLMCPARLHQEDEAVASAEPPLHTEAQIGKGLSKSANLWEDVIWTESRLPILTTPFRVDLASVNLITVPEGEHPDEHRRQGFDHDVRPYMVPPRDIHVVVRRCSVTWWTAHMWPCAPERVPPPSEKTSARSAQRRSRRWAVENGGGYVLVLSPLRCWRVRRWGRAKRRPAV